MQLFAVDLHIPGREFGLVLISVNGQECLVLGRAENGGLDVYNLPEDVRQTLPGETVVEKLFCQRQSTTKKYPTIRSL